MIKVFTDSYDNKKFFYHFNIFGLKFRIATNTRGFNKYGTYATGRGRVLNFGRKYICFIPMFWSIFSVDMHYKSPHCYMRCIVAVGSLL